MVFGIDAKFFVCLYFLHFCRNFVSNGHDADSEITSVSARHATLKLGRRPTSTEIEAQFHRGLLSPRPNAFRFVPRTPGW